MSTWQLDPAHTVVSFTAKHMMITKVRGIFTSVGGTIAYDEADPARSSVEVTIPAATVATGMEPRDNHLRSADFLDAETYPTLAFRSTSIERRGDRWAITGDLTVRGVTRPVVLDTEALGIVKGMDGRRHAGFEATTKIRRSDWGLTWNVGLEAGGWLVSDDVAIELEVAADEVAPVAAAEPVGAASA
ncbi:MAG: YceI family protein [Chloroflexi bacterium]|nr:YceI family protein [Chloroflexota bacterium]